MTRISANRMWTSAQQPAAAIILAAATVAFSCGFSRAEEAPTPQPTCELARGPVRTVARVIDGETVALDDGRELRLAGIQAPRAQDAGAQLGAWPLEEASRIALAELILGKQVQIAFGASKVDRYGRLIGHLFAMRDGVRQWIEGELLGRGLARVMVLPGDGACLSELLAHERLARTDNTGVWQVTIYAPKDAFQTAALLSVRSTFQIVRGRIASVGRTKSAVYLNFGKDPRTDFTVRIPRMVLRRNEAWNAALEKLNGRTIEVRGWIERRNGPMISLTHPGELIVPGEEESLPEPTISQSELTDGDPPSHPTSRGFAGGNQNEKKNRPEHSAPSDLDL